MYQKPIDYAFLAENRKNQKIGQIKLYQPSIILYLTNSEQEIYYFHESMNFVSSTSGWKRFFYWHRNLKFPRAKLEVCFCYY